MERKGLKMFGVLKNYIFIYSFKFNKLFNFFVFCLIRDYYDVFYLIGIYIYIKLGIFGDIIFLY